MEKNTNAAFANLNFDYCINEMFRIRNSKKKKKKIETSLSMKKDLSEIKKFDLTLDEFWDYDFKFI